MSYSLIRVAVTTVDFRTVIMGPSQDQAMMALIDLNAPQRFAVPDPFCDVAGGHLAGVEDEEIDAFLAAFPQH